MSETKISKINSTTSKISPSKSKGWIGCDLDGTLAYYDQWRGPNHIGPPVPKMLRRVKAWLRAGQEVRIVTARVAPRPGGEHEDSRAAIERWLDEWLGERLRITHCKDLGMKLLFDDRAIAIQENTGEILGGQYED